MDLWSVLFDILTLLLTAIILGGICERLKQNAILGYLAAGTLLGPNAFRLIDSSDQVSALAELGVSLLLFTIGLEFAWPKLKKLGFAALGGGGAQVIVTLLLGAGGALIVGQEIRPALAIGAIITLSSTAFVLRLLIARTEIESSHGRYALGILLMQDIAVVPLVLLVTVLSGDGSLGQVGFDILKTIGWAIVLVGMLYLILNKLIPAVYKLDSLHSNRDLPILLAIVIGLGSAWASHKMGLSPALGAFVAGLLLGDSPVATQVRADIASIRTLLVTLFFSSIGMLGDPAWFVGNLPAVLGLVAAIVVGKVLIIWFVLRLFRLPNTTALATGLCLGQAGEFSFVLATIGRGTIIDDYMFSLIISSTIVTLFLTPYLVALAPRASGGIIRALSKAKLVSPPETEDDTPSSATTGHLVIIGYGPAGQAVGQSLAGMGDRITVIDLNPRSMYLANQHGFIGHIGDAMHADVLEHSGIASATAVVVTVPDPMVARNTVELIRSIAPDVLVIVRARFHRYAQDLITAGAHEVIDEEQLIGAQLADRLRGCLHDETSDPDDGEASESASGE
mgnify:CR=1 FL=1|tara:strand:- start:181816 stop:183510 length:1695 start_codon:yes stop_codon:yes gene_type:complete